MVSLVTFTSVYNCRWTNYSGAFPFKFNKKNMKTPLLSGILSVCLCFGVFADESETPEELRPGHSHAGEAFNEGPRQFARRIEGTGDVHFPLTTNWEEGQTFFDQGIGQLHGFWYFEAERTFRHIAAKDPDCAMAYWGMAMANWENQKRAREFIAKAVALKEKASQREQMWIDAQDAFLKDGQKDQKARKKKLISALEDIIFEYPDDIEAKAFLVVRIWQFSQQGIEIGSPVAVDSVMQDIFAKAPMHPAHHYRIHLWDQSKAGRAVDSAAKLGHTAPAIAHMWHMPGHIFSKLQRYDDSAWHQEASVRMDHKQMLEGRILPDQIHNYAHNSEWLIRNMIYQGMSRRAVEMAKGMLANPRHPKLNMPTKGGSSAGYGRTRLLSVLEQFELWDELIALSESVYLDPTEDAGLQEERLRALGVANFEKRDAEELASITGDIGARLTSAEEAHKKAQDEARKKAEEEKKDEKETKKAIADAGKGPGDKVNKIKKIAEELAFYKTVLSGDKEEAKKSIDKAKRSKERIALLHLQLGDEAKALEVSKEAVDNAKNQILPLAARAEILHAVGKTDDARTVFAELQKLSSRIDLAVPPFQRLKDLLVDLGEPEDWRIPIVIKEDVGDRPALDSFGSINWTPPVAPDFTLPDGDGSAVSLHDFSGKPVVLIFYLGHGCLHCVEQLNAFAPKYAAFREAGFDILAISSDNAAGLKESQALYADSDSGSTFPFRLLSNESLDVFKDYRAHDDFENKAMHGTFVIDPKGRILWQDTGPEPFADADFVLKEGKRLMEIHCRPGV
jgi:peroxiredoxin